MRSRASSVVSRVTRRPWPLPARPWVITQTWCDLLFAHWPIEASALRRRVPRGLHLDEWDGHAWVSIVALRVHALRVRGMPPLPTAQAFAQINVRTYVTDGRRPGVWFFSIDANSRLAGWAARRAFGLPYRAATMSIARTPDGIHCSSVRREGRRAVFAGTYGPTGPVFNATTGSVDYFLTERYCAYAADRQGHVWRADILHPPWPLQPARASIEIETVSAAAGLGLSASAPLLHFCARQDARVWAPVNAAVSSRGAGSEAPARDDERRGVHGPGSARS